MEIDHKRAIKVLGGIIADYQHKMKMELNQVQKSILKVKIACLEFSIEEMKETKAFGGAKSMVDYAIKGSKSPEIKGLFDS